MLAEDAQIDDLFKRFDADASGTISSAEFLKFVSEIVQRESLDVEVITLRGLLSLSRSLSRSRSLALSLSRGCISLAEEA